LLGRPVERSIHKQVKGNERKNFAFGFVHDKSPPARANALSLGVLAVTLGEKYLPMDGI